MEQVALTQPDYAPIGAAQGAGRGHKRLQDRIEIECRSADHLEHLGGCGLLLQSLLCFVEEVGIVYRDDGQIRERPRQLDVMRVERPGLRRVTLNKPIAAPLLINGVNNMAR